MKRIRNSIKAIIIQDGKLLVTRNQSHAHGTYYLLPGGGQEHGETMPEALQRECREEIGCQVQPGELRFVREFIEGKDSPCGGEGHQIEFMFPCTLHAGEIPVNGEGADDQQTGVEWISLEELENITFFPAALIPYLKASFPTDAPIYLGDVR